MLTEQEKNKIKNYFLVTQGLDIQEVTEFHGYLLLKPYGVIWFKDKIYQDKTISQTLDLFNNKIHDISALAGLSKLENLSLSYNKISDISALAGIKKLKQLYLSSNSITDITALAGLTNLEHLYLPKNNISDISSLADLQNIKILIVENNPLKNSQVEELRKQFPHCKVYF